MTELFNKIYLKLHFSEIKIAKLILRKVSIEDIYSNISKSCWLYGIQQQIILKNSDRLIIELISISKKHRLILEYHRCEMVFEDDYDIFENYLCRYDVKKGVYITTGIFEEYLFKKSRHNFQNNIKLIDGTDFVIKQLCINKNTNGRINKNTLSFLKYLP